MGSTKMSKILTLGALEAEKLQKARWPKYCETPCMRRTNYPPAVSLSPTLAKIIDSKLQGLQSSAHFPESTHELKTELNNYEAKLGAGDLHISDKALMHHLGQQGTTDIKSTIFSGPLSQGKHLDRAYFIFSLAPPSKLQPDDNHDLACFSSISPP